jgi:hypothetical protein
LDWDGYEIYDLGVSGPLSDVPRREAHQAFNKLMAERPARIEMLQRLVAASDVHLDDGDKGIQELNDWFVADVSANPDRPGRLASAWYSVVSDIRLFLGEAIIRRCPGLRWEFFTGGKRNPSYQHAVIMGFSEWPKVDLDLYRQVAAYGTRIITSRGSIGPEGTVTVRGVVIDLDAHLRRDLAEGIVIEPDYFRQRVRWAEAHA